MNGLLIGILGSAILMAGWAYETFQAIKHHQELVDLNFAFIYLIGISFLTYYSYLIQNAVFLWLNFMLLVLIGVEAIVTLYLRRK